MTSTTMACQIGAKLYRCSVATCATKKTLHWMQCAFMPGVCVPVGKVQPVLSVQQGQNYSQSESLPERS